MSGVSNQHHASGGAPFIERVDWLGVRRRYYTREEVARHCTADDAWLIVAGKVYDATPWLGTHPAGVQTILRRAGQDATRDFEFHSQAAMTMWKSLLIGYVEGGATVRASSDDCVIS